jgi:predicted DNA-binding transcriptional regulator AlpA
MSRLKEGGLLRVSDIVNTKKKPGLLPIGRSTWLDGVKKGRFPQPVRLGLRTPCWRAEDIQALINDGLKPAAIGKQENLRPVSILDPDEDQ